MSNLPDTGPQADLRRILDSAERLGVELDESEALQWLTAMAADPGDQEVIVDVESGVFGHRVTMLDFNAAQLAYYRKMGEMVGFEEEPGVVETALALSGSAAQSKIQTYPGDCDFFERINIRAETREAACLILARVMRTKALQMAKGPTYQLMEVRFGSFPEDVLVGDSLQKAGAPISWTAAQIEAGGFEASRPDGTPLQIEWEAVAHDPGWCKLDWVVADPVRGELANASNMLDVTWEAPDGAITPLDGYLDPYFQEVYLEAESIPIFSKLARHVSADALDTYVEQLEREVKKYLTKNPNYGKAAKRMYNIFRMSGRYGEAAFIRELFDEPATMLYQVWSLIRTVDEVADADSDISIETVRAQADQLILRVVDVLEGAQEQEIVRHLLRLRDSLELHGDDPGRDQQVRASRAQVINIVNNFFYERLTALPSIKAYIQEMETS